MNVQVSLPPEQEDFVADSVASGRYASASEVIIDALRVLDLQQQDDVKKLKWLQEAWRVGIESGDVGPFNREAFLVEARARKAPRR